MSFWVYILRCADDSYYTGQTDNLEKRLNEHNSGAIPTCYTFKRRPLQLVFSQAFTTHIEALESERQIKGWSRKKKEAMIRGDWAEVSRLAKSGTTAPDEREPAESLSPSVHSEPVEEMLADGVPSFHTMANVLRQVQDRTSKGHGYE